MRVRVAAIQYQLRHVQGWDQFEEQVEFVLGAAAEYRPNFVLLPEIFTTQLLSLGAAGEPAKTVRELSRFTPAYCALMASHARRHGFYLAAGSHPTMREGRLYNTAYLFAPDGRHFTQDKLHRTRWEKERWDTTAGEELAIFETPHGRVGILICYDVEFPELARQLCEAGADILLVPSCTDDRQGLLRVRYCCHARAIENQVYVAMTSTVGNLRVPGLQMHYGQAAILAPSDLPFPRDGIAAEGVANTEQIVVADLDLELLGANRLSGTTIPILDKRKELYDDPVRRVAA
jgi:predicted amidohydrolase